MEPIGVYPLLSLGHEAFFFSLLSGRIRKLDVDQIVIHLYYDLVAVRSVGPARLIGRRSLAGVWWFATA
jgi:hypothetical protein